MGLEEARAFVRENLEKAAAELRGLGIPRPALEGKVLRPLSAYLSVPTALRPELDTRFWRGALAVEMVHEASLLHDDILDEASERRGRPTLAASAGVGPALVLGDHLLTGAYRMAASAASPAFLELFIRAVERTVAGEIAQESAQGRVVEEEEYRRNITGKSGELFRAIFALAPSLMGVGDPDEAGRIGARLGCIYQMVDDALDYCPDTARGKPPMQDYRQKKWTWPLGLLSFQGFDTPEEEILSALFDRGSSGRPSPMERGAVFLRRETAGLLRSLPEAGLDGEGLRPLLEGWMERVAAAHAREADRFTDLRGLGALTLVSRSEPVQPAALLEGELAWACRHLGYHQGRLDYFGKHAKTFRFASRLFPPEALRSVAGVYAFCRFTDDLVDEAPERSPEGVASRLRAWGTLAHRAFEGERTGIGLLDEVMGEAREKTLPFSYVEELLKGVAMDLEPREYRTVEELRTYTFRVASVVGGWLTELSGVRDPWVLDRAFALGHAMQLTNILRDVGEDLARGRIYLPQDRMARHGVDRNLLEAMASHRAPLFPGYHALLEELMAASESEYDRAQPGIPALPTYFRAPVAVASRSYRAIHDEIRRNDYDNLNQRARTSLTRKVSSFLQALLELGRASSRAGGSERPLVFSGISRHRAEQARDLSA